MSRSERNSSSGDLITSSTRPASRAESAWGVSFSAVVLLLIIFQLQTGSAFFISPRTTITKCKSSVSMYNTGDFSGVIANRNTQPNQRVTTVARSNDDRGKRLRSELRATADMDVGEGQAKASESSSREPKYEGFEWTRQWYPIAVIRDLEAMDPREPYPVKLLGQSIVVWMDPKDGQWKAFADRCPHRWAPLSEGRVDQTTGRLQCIYHGWEFEGDGKCGAIPQVDPAARERAQNSRRACATVIPTKVVQEKLWLWPDTSPEGVAASEHKSPAVVEDMSDAAAFGGNWYMRDLEYGFDTLLENLSDPAHIPFAHHGVIGNRKMGQAPMEIGMEEGLGEDEFRTATTGFAGAKNLKVGFEAPSLVYYQNNFTEMLPSLMGRLPPPFKVMGWVMNKLKLDKRMALAMKGEGKDDPSNRLLLYFVGYAVPTTPGKCRIFTRTGRNFFLQHPVIPRKWRNSLAVEHLAQHLVLDGDSMALHVQERSLKDVGEHGSAHAERTFYMPSAADAAVRTFRKWYSTRAGGGPEWAQGVDPLDLGAVVSHEKALDRFDSHTKHCSACGKAYRVSGNVKRASVGGALFFLAAAAASPRGVLALGLAGGALASSGLALAMDKRQQKFVYVEYKHATRDG